MNYIILFMEGIITFISPCILPMIPIYMSYFMGDSENPNSKNALINSIGFVIGFSMIFILLGAAAGSLGVFLKENMKIFNVVSGLLMIIFGLSYAGVINISFLQRSYKLNSKAKKLNVFSSILFGMIFAIGWTPCIGTFLSSALALAANSQHVIEGVSMLLVYSLGLGLPFIISALLIDSLKSTFDFIKRNYEIINKVSGGLLIIIGVAMMTGYLNLILAWLTI